jgi:hypothetical protein
VSDLIRVFVSARVDHWARDPETLQPICGQKASRKPTRTHPSVQDRLCYRCAALAGETS